MWMDESHHWLIARESQNLSELLYNYRYDGHPLLWISIMHGYSYLSEQVIGIQYIHGMIALFSAIVLILRAPFPFLVKIGIVFSYFSLYEYGVISRNYSSLMLLLFCLPLYWKNHQKIPFTFWFILGLIANTHLFGLFFSVVFGSIFLLKYVILNDQNKQTSLSAYGIFIVLVLISVITIIPPTDHPSVDTFGFNFSFSKLADAIMLLFKSLFPIPDFTSDFYWNTNILTSKLKWIIAPLAILCWFLPFIFRWINYWLVLVWYIIALLLVFFFLATQLHAGLRYGGVMLLFLVALKWIDSYGLNNSTSVRRIYLSSKLTAIILGIIFFIQVSSGIAHTILDIKKPFSSSKEIYEYLDEQGYTDFPIFSNAFCNSISIRNYYSQPVYFLNIGKAMNFCEWNELNKAQGFENQYDLDTSIQKSQTYMKEKNIDHVILLYHGEDIFDTSLDVHRMNNSQNVTHLASFNNGIVKRENFNIYLIEQ